MFLFDAATVRKIAIASTRKEKLDLSNIVPKPNGNEEFYASRTRGRKHQAPAKRKETVQIPVYINYKDNSAAVSFGNNILKITKKQDGSVWCAVNRAGDKEMDFKNELDFKSQIEKRLKHEIEGNRPFLGPSLGEIFAKLDLTSSITRTVKAIRSSFSPGIFNAKEGQYELERSPIAYLLVRHKNTGSYYCLSLAQEMFDLMYGLGEAKRLGLYDAKYATELNFANSPHAKVIDYVPGMEMKKGYVIRFWREDAGVRTIGICIADGRSAHIIGHGVHVEDVKPVMDENWNPKQIIIPDATFKEKPIKLAEYGKSFGRGATLEEISPVIKKQLRFLKDKNLAAIEEILYQLNKDRFEVKSNSRNTYAALKTSSTLSIPDYWLQR